MVENRRDDDVLCHGSWDVSRWVQNPSGILHKVYTSVVGVSHTARRDGEQGYRYVDIHSENDDR